MITGSISASDYLHAQWLHRAQAVRRGHVFSAIAVAAGIALYLVHQQKWGWIAGGAGIGGALGELVMSRLYLPWKVRRLHRQQKDFASPVTYTWDSEYIEAKGVSGQTKRPWSNYLKYKENEYIFLLYHSDILFEMFPKAWFQDPAQVADFRQRAQRAGTGNAGSRPRPHEGGQ